MLGLDPSISETSPVGQEMLGSSPSMTSKASEAQASRPSTSLASESTAFFTASNCG